MPVATEFVTIKNSASDGGKSWSEFELEFLVRQGGRDAAREWERDDARALEFGREYASKQERERGMGMAPPAGREKGAGHGHGTASGTREGREREIVHVHVHVGRGEGASVGTAFPMSLAVSALVRADAESEALVQVSGLRKYFPVTGGLFGGVVNQVRAVEDVAFVIGRGETLGLVGESGCGKTTVGRMVLRLLEPSAGSVRFAGHDLLSLGRSELRQMRRRMQIVFQDPYSSLNPRRTVGDAIGEPLFVHGLAKGAEIDRKVSQLLERVGFARQLPQPLPA